MSHLLIYNLSVKDNYFVTLSIGTLSPNFTLLSGVQRLHEAVLELVQAQKHWVRVTYESHRD